MEDKKSELLQYAREYAAAGKDLYELLSVSADAAQPEVHRAWRKASLKHHPDKAKHFDPEIWQLFERARDVLSPIGARIGEKRFVYFLTAGAAVFQLLVWFVPNIIGEAVSLALVGLLLGPIYPCAATVFTRNLSRQEQVSGLGVISAFGSSGGAVAPFTTGLLAQAAGTFVLHPIAIGLFGAMIVCWYTIPAARKRTE
ncbi:hypothetical protein CHU98_g11319 [Xylaria longipes]|nr:hypothetical protein CHU98_g11319 [Xylaria longipes]